MKRWFVAFSKILLIFAFVYAVVLAVGFFGLKFGLTNASSEVDPNNEIFRKNNEKISGMKKISKVVESGDLKDLTDGEISAQIDKLIQIKEERNKNYCKVEVVGKTNPLNARKILEIYELINESQLVAKMVMAISLRLEKNSEFQNLIQKCESDENNNLRRSLTLENLKQDFYNTEGVSVFPWVNNDEWETIKTATLKDKELINRAGEEAGIEPRHIVSSMVVEQLRLFHSQRELFERFFKPLKILGNATKISLGVMGIKEATAIQIEDHLKDSSSEYYLGKDYEHLLEFKTNNPAQERYQRLTDEENHYYSYLYSALYLKQIIVQWKKAGYDIEDRPEIIGTLFNVGFAQSHPKADPKIGGSKINVGEGVYSFGSLAYEFYYSGELSDDFPYNILPSVHVEDRVEARLGSDN